MIGDSCRIEAGAHVRPYTVLGTDVIVKADAVLERAVCHDHVYVGPGTSLRACVIGRNTDLRAHVRIEEGTVVGDECFIGADAVVNPNVKVYPFKTVEAGAVVTSSIVWESRGARTLFGRHGVRGLGNVDINPEVVVRLAMAYGTALPKGSTITVSRDTSRIARALKRALIAGVNLAGVNVEDIELATVPLTRFQVHNSMSQGGVTVRLAPDDPDTVEIRFFDEDGRDIDPGAQRKIERLLYREDYRRAFGGEIGDIVFPPRALEFYSSALERVVDIETIHERVYKIVARLLLRRGVDRDAGPAHQARRRGARGQPVREHVVGHRRARWPATGSSCGSPISSAVSQSDLGFVIDPDGEIGTVVDDLGRVLAPSSCCSRSSP